MKRWRPRPDQDFPWIAVFTIPFLWLAGVLLLSGVLAAIARTMLDITGFPPFLIVLTMVLSWVCGLGHSLYARLAWNFRAKHVRESGTPPHSAFHAKRWLRWVLGLPYLFLLSVATPIAALYAVENTRGSLVLWKVRSNLTAQGEILQFDKLIPPAVPADQNFAEAPLFADLFRYARSESQSGIVWQKTNALQAMHRLSLPERHLPRRDTAAGRPYAPHGLEHWAQAFRQSKPDSEPGGSSEFVTESPDPEMKTAAARSVWDELQVANAIVEEVRPFAHRPYAQFPLHWEEGHEMLLPHLSQLKGLVAHLELRVRAQLALDKPEPAFQDAVLAVRVADLLKEEPLLISQMVRIASLEIARRIVWWGLEADAWDDSQWKQLQELFAEPRFRDPLLDSLQRERAGALRYFETVKLPDWSFNSEEADPLWSEMELTSMPRGWVRLAGAEILTRYQELIEASREMMSTPAGENWLDTFDALQRIANADDLDSFWPWQNAVRQFYPTFGNVFGRVFRTEFEQQAATTACALARYRIAHEQWPQALADLVPNFLERVPEDPVDGQPIRFETTSDGLFRLWSVGLNGVDDGGRVQKVSSIVQSEELDWIWPRWMAIQE